MANCSEQEFVAKMVLDNTLDSVVEDLSRLPYAEAYKKAKSYNQLHFFGNNLIQVKRNNYSREDGTPMVSFSKEMRDKVLQDKIDRDNYLETQQRIEELDSALNYSIDDDYLPAVDNLEYDEFDYAITLANKMLLKEKLEKQRDLLKNKKQGKEGLTQIEYLNETVRKLHMDIHNLQKNEQSLDNYLTSVNRDIRNIKMLLKNPTLENLQAVSSYIETLKLMTDDAPQGFLRIPLSAIKEKDSEVWEKLAEVHREISLIEDETKTKIKEVTKAAIVHHLKQKEKYKDWSEKQLKEEALKFYQNQIDKTGKGKMSAEKSPFNMLDDQEDMNILISVMYKVYTDAIAMNNVKSLREKLSNMENNVHRELIRLGYSVKSGLRTVADEGAVFLRDSKTAHQLIGKFSGEWVAFKKYADNAQKDIARFLYKPDKTPQELKTIQENFDHLNKHADFIDVTLLPEIIEDTDFSDFADSFGDTAKAEEYGADLMRRLGEREYNKMVKEQKEKIYAYQVFQEAREARLRDKYDLDVNDDLQSNIPDSAWNTHLTLLYAKSPFVFSQSFKESGTNKIAKPHYKYGKPSTVYSIIADLEYVSIIPKDTENSRFFDENFETIENNEIFREAWNVMADLVEFNNMNGFNQNPNNLTEYSLASQAKRITGLPQRFMSLFSRRALDNLHKALTTDRYRAPEKSYNVAGQITNVDQEIETLYKYKILQYKNPDKKTQLRVRMEAKEQVLAKQDPNIIGNILATSELTEVFKAKREAENQLKFLLKHLGEATDRKRFKELADFFINRQLYQFNNRPNWGRVGRDYAISDHQGAAWTRFYTAKERQVRKVAKESLETLKEHLKEAKNETESKKITEEISSIEVFLNSGGKVMTPGSILEALAIKIPRLMAFSFNVSAQTTNYMMGSLNAMEMDGREGYWDSGVYSNAVSFTRKWRYTLGTESEKKELRVGELLLTRLQIFQNSGNEIFKMEKSRTASSIEAILENPMNFVSEVEKTIQRPQIYALMSQVYITDKKGNVVPMWDSETRTFPAFEEVNGSLALRKDFNNEHNRNTFLSNNTQEYANTFGDSGRVPKALAVINGDYRESSVYLFEKRIWTALPMLFKRWFVASIEKNFGVLDRLKENEHSGLANAAVRQRALGLAFSSGVWLGPAAMAIGIGMYGFREIRHSLRRDTGHTLKSFFSLKNALAAQTLTNNTASRNVRFALAAAAQSISMIIDPLTKKPLIHSGHIRRIIQMKDKKKDGSEYTMEEIRQVKDDMYFLSTALAQTLRMLIYRFAVMMLLRPTGDEEEEYKLMLKDKDKFWTRMFADPDTTLYYMLENTLSELIEDGNMLTNITGLFRSDDLFNTDRIMRLVNSTEDTMAGNDMYLSGDNVGEDKMGTQFLKFITPSSLTDGGSLGFGSKSKKDFEDDNFIDNFKRPTIEFVEKARKKARVKRKRELERGRMFENFTREHKDAEIQAILKDEFPTVHEDDFHPVTGKPHPHIEATWSNFWPK